MICKGEQVAVNLSIWNLDSDSEEWSDSAVFDGTGKKSGRKVAKILRAMAKEIETLELDGEE